MKEKVVLITSKDVPSKQSTMLSFPFAGRKDFRPDVKWNSRITFSPKLLEELPNRRLHMVGERFSKGSAVARVPASK